MLRRFVKFILLLLFLSGLALKDFAQDTRYIVELTDKADNAFDLQAPATFLSARALDRRTRYNIAIDSTDLPVTKRYLDSIQSSGAVTILNTSKWLNQVAIQTTDANALTRISNFPFVKSYRAIAARNGSDFQRNKFATETTEATVNLREPMQTELSNVYDYGLSYGQVHLHQGEFLHNHGFSGQGMQLAMLDAGFPNYPTLPTFDSVRLNGQFLDTWDFVTNNSNVNGANYHGSLCLSTIAANVPGTFVGTAPKTSFYLFRTEDAPTEYQIEEQNLAAGLERADSLGADLASISLGYSSFDGSAMPDHTYPDMNGNTTISARAADWAARKGMLIVVANGNEGTSSWHYVTTPADADSVLSVGAVNTAGAVADFSSYGPSSDGQVKPGVAAVGWGAIGNFGAGQPGSFNGTSLACPNMAGLATCLWQAFPEENNMGIISALQQSASRASAPDDRIGYGIPDMKKAFVILLKRFYSQKIQQAGCNVLISFTAKSSAAMNFEIERKLPADLAYSTIKIQNGSGSFTNNSFTYSDDLSSLSTPTTISYRIKMNIDADSSFYFEPVIVNHNNSCATYTFTGNGDWTDISNWEGALIPPAILPAGSSIVINPITSGECVLNINQQVASGAYFTVLPGRKLRVPGNLTIQQ